MKYFNLSNFVCFFFSIVAVGKIPLQEQRSGYGEFGYARSDVRKTRLLCNLPSGGFTEAQELDQILQMQIVGHRSDFLSHIGV